MADPKGTVRNLRPFMPGSSPNPGGRAAGSRNRVQAKFLTALADDFEAHGATAIATVREKDPSSYVRVIASLMPRDMESSRPLDGMSVEDLATAIATLRALST